MANGRKYASFFEWPDKDRKELGVVEELLCSLNAVSRLGLCNPRTNRPDPPDCVCENGKGNLVAVEVVEFVCKEAARRNANGENVMRVWSPSEISAKASSLLAGKDAKKYLGGPYSGIVVCLFTDEPMLTLNEAKKELGSVKFGPFSQITSAFLVFSYDPHTKSYPTVPLEISA